MLYYGAHTAPGLKIVHVHIGLHRPTLDSIEKSMKNQWKINSGTHGCIILIQNFHVWKNLYQLLPECLKMALFVGYAIHEQAVCKPAPDKDWWKLLDGNSHKVLEWETFLLIILSISKIQNYENLHHIYLNFKHCRQWAIKILIFLLAFENEEILQYKEWIQMGTRQNGQNNISNAYGIPTIWVRKWWINGTKGTLACKSPNYELMTKSLRQNVFSFTYFSVHLHRTSILPWLFILWQHTYLFRFIWK